MKNFTLIIFWMIFSFVAVAQNPSIDSSKKHNNVIYEDTLQINGWNKIANDFIHSNQYDSTFRYAKKAMDAGEKLQYQHGLVYAYHSLAAFNFHIKEYKTGKFFLLKSLSAAILEKDKKSIALDYKELADLYKLQGNFKLATESSNKFGLYTDSLKLEDSIKRAAELQAINNLKEKQKADLAASDAKASAAYEAKKQQIFYISLAVLVVLSVLIIWLLVSRSNLRKKKEVELLAENAALDAEKVSGILNQPKNIDIEKQAFLQKIAEKELSTTNVNVEKKLHTVAKEKAAVLQEEIIKQINEEKNISEKKVDEEQLVTMVVNEESPVLKQNNSDKSIINDVEIDTNASAATFEKNYSYLITPNQLQSFTAKLTDDKVKLFWKTADESNIKCFELQKSMDDLQFITIKTINSKAFAENGYEIFDMQPLPGINYYRLEIIDTNGNFVYGPTANIEVLAATTLELIAYPTHIKDMVMVTASGGKMPVLVNVFNRLGKKELTIEVPPTTTPVYLNKLTAGIYTLQMKCQGKTVLQQITKI